MRLLLYNGGWVQIAVGDFVVSIEISLSTHRLLRRLGAPPDGRWIDLRNRTARTIFALLTAVR
jgi:hypothetical protein